MLKSVEMPWDEIHSFLIDCGGVRNPKEFCSRVIKGIITLIPYDQGRIYYINDNKVVYDEYLIGVDKKWVILYHKYYSQIENGRYSVSSKVDKWRNCCPNLCFFYNWTNHDYDEFFADYIQPQGIGYSTGFHVCDLNNSIKAIFMLDRSDKSDKFSDKELQIIKIVQAHLNNLYKNFYVNMSDYYENYQFNAELLHLLTPRESEVMNLLIKGVAPKSIAKKLYISHTTVYKHIAHIYEKLDVGNIQELLVKLLDTKSQTIQNQVI